MKRHGRQLFFPAQAVCGHNKRTVYMNATSSRRCLGYSSPILDEKIPGRSNKEIWKIVSERTTYIVLGARWFPRLMSGYLSRGPTKRPAPGSALARESTLASGPPFTSITHSSSSSIKPGCELVSGQRMRVLSAKYSWHIAAVSGIWERIESCHVASLAGTRINLKSYAVPTPDVPKRDASDASYIRCSWSVLFGVSRVLDPKRQSMSDCRRYNGRNIPGGRAQPLACVVLLSL